jgi:predicted transcriptional regulator
MCDNKTKKIRWTSEEELQLDNLFQQGKTVEEISNILNRSTSAIQSRLKTISTNKKMIMRINADESDDEEKVVKHISQKDRDTLEKTLEAVKLKQLRANEAENMKAKKYVEYLMKLLEKN